MATADGLQFLAGLLERSLSHDATVRAAAEKELSDFVAYPDYAIGLLSVVATKHRKYGKARRAASFHFKTLIFHRWPKSDGDADHLRPLPTFECSIIKEKILDILLNASHSIQVEIAEALVVIAASDFPSKWSSVLPSIASWLAAAVGAQEVARINTVLVAAGSLFMGFRQQQQKELNYGDIDYCVNGFADILTEVFQFAIGLLLNPMTATGPVFECLQLCCQIFHSFTSIHLHMKFKSVIDLWMDSFYTMLTASYPTADLDLLHTAVCDNLRLFADKYVDVLSTAKWGSFVTAVRCLLMSPTAGAQLVVSGLRFLTTVAEGKHSGLLESPDVLKEVYVTVIMPSLWPRDEDVDMFNGNWIEYVRLDSEVCDTDTPRRAACQFLRVLATNYREQVVALVSTYMLQACKAGLVNKWKAKDAVVYLIIALRKDLDCTADWAHVIESCFTSLIVPELCVVRDDLSDPMLKATALRFLKEFLDQMPKDTVLGLLPHMVTFLKNDSNVIHSYAATFIETWLNMADAATLVSTNSIALEIVQNLLTRLCPDSYENPYLIKCLSLILRSANIEYDAASSIVKCLVQRLEKLCDRPTDSEFSKCMFEVLETLTKQFGGDRMLDSDLWNLLERVLVEDIAEFVTYACKQLGQFVNSYHMWMWILPLLLRSAAWHRAPCVAACLCLLRALLPKVATQQNGLLPILLKFKELLQVSSTQKTAVYILNTIVEGVEFHIIAPHMHDTWDCVFNRLRTLQSDKRAAMKWAKCIVYFLSVFIVRYGNTSLENLIQLMNWEKEFIAFIKLYWVRNLKLMKDSRAVSMSAVASIILLSENSYLCDDMRTWTTLLDKCLEHILRTDVQYAGLNEDQLLKDKEPKSFFGASCNTLLTRFPGRFNFIINTLQQPHRDYLCQLLPSLN